MTTLLEVLDKLDLLKNKETNTVAFRGPFIGVLSYSRIDNSSGWVNFYRRKEPDWIYNEIFRVDEPEIMNESPLSFRLKSIGGCALYEGSPDYIRAEKKLRSFGLY